jgi:hypothetical protein
MLMNMEPEHDLGDYDVIVVGGGCAGVTAAIAAGRSGSRVALIEANGYLGGTSTTVLDSFYGFFAPDADDTKVVFGIADEVIQRLERDGTVIYRPNDHGGGIGIGYDPELLKVTWEQLALEAGVELLLHSTVYGVELSEPGRIGSISFVALGERYRIAGGHVIDASGDASVSKLAGATFLPVSKRSNQSLTTTMRLANVDYELARSFPLASFADLVAEARRAGLDLPHDDIHIHRAAFEGGALGLVTRIAVEDVLDVRELTSAEVRGRAQVREYVEFFTRFVPGYGRAELVSFSNSIGIRRSRRIRGEVVLTGDALKSGKTWPDVIARSGSPIEVQDVTGSRWEYLPTGTIYDIPLRALIPFGFRNVAVAGRCLSADEEAHASARLMAQCMAMGEGAGVAVDLARRLGVAVGDVPATELERHLKLGPR